MLTPDDAFFDVLAECDEDQRASRCAHDASLVADVEVDEVLQPARELYDAAAGQRAAAGRAFPTSATG